MQTSSQQDDRLLKRLLELTESADDAAPDPHPDEETLALFAMGKLREPQRGVVMQHIADCTDCRRAVSLDSLVQEQRVQRRPLPFLPRGAFARGTFSAAALLIVLVTGYLAWILILPSRSEPEYFAEADALLREGRFEETRVLCGRARDHGIESDRLRSLESQAWRQLPGPSALAVAGCLTNFGFDMTGTVARNAARQPMGSGLTEALAVLAGGGDHHVALLLNRGHASLSLDKPRDALRDFEKVVQSVPHEALGWLGQGLAQFMLEDYEAAAASFQNCVAIQARHRAARINLAMTLEQLQRWNEALRVWEDLLGDALPPGQREQIRSIVRELKKRPQP
jgi:tetratricopeptide (TPR) repeat protein